MCQSTSIVFSCNHWGPRKISRPCLWATSENIKAGCFLTSEPEGVEHLDHICDSCKIKETLGSTSSLTHVGMDGIRRPFTRVGTEAVDDLDRKRKKIAQISEERRRTLSQAGRLEERRQRDQVLDQLHMQLMQQERERHEESKRKLKAWVSSEKRGGSHAAGPRWILFSLVFASPLKLISGPSGPVNTTTEVYPTIQRSRTQGDQSSMDLKTKHLINTFTQIYTKP
ncbi:hypothetical protein BOTCAL_0151g00230 [Botryotinia calthae]|uniref:Uncharacterized protein n=1 Tax=Botryotinia calthae TaxID=38488 RepID=A0A4Y8D2V7_9HELO|nr:hypothetical protein BOTCAL_0151g00230 [Botryotinia calthae]